jgi:hypothetical protein
VPRKRADFPPPREPVPAPQALPDVLDRVDAIAVNPRCFSLSEAPGNHGLSRVAERQGLELWVRAAPTKPETPRRKRK